VFHGRKGSFQFIRTVIVFTGKEFILHEDSPLVSAGDSVMVNVDPDTFQLAQHNAGGWNDSMAEVRERERERGGK